MHAEREIAALAENLFFLQPQSVENQSRAPSDPSWTFMAFVVLKRLRFTPLTMI
jgi:hypothetical protein